MNLVLSPISEEVDFSQQFDIEIRYLTNIPKLYEDFFSKLSIAKILNKSRVQNGIGSIGNDLPVNVVSLDLNVDRILKYCFHKFKFRFHAFVLLELVRSGSSTPPERPGLLQPGLRNLMYNLFTLC